MDTRNIDKALDEYIKDGADGAFVTGWVMVASISSPSHDIGSSDGYVTITSDGLPHHAQLGLLKMSLDDKQAMALIASLSSMMGSIGDDEDED
jgi:hypothetical protein